MISIRAFGTMGLLALLCAASPAQARDVSFVEPNTGITTATDEAFKIEPKSEIDIGDSVINIVRRTTLFFVNQTSQPVKIEKVTLSSDSAVAAQVANDDCSKQSTLPPLSRCSIELSITPSGPGGWSIELMMTHNGPGRITRAKINGKTAGSDSGDKRERGLFLSTKDSKGIDFGDVTVGSGKIVRSALMVNDSPTPITLYSIDVIEADKALQRLDEGCSEDMELKPGESCPVTLVWTPSTHGIISTDLIIRHSGQLGFAVVTLRGTAKDGTGGVSGTGDTGASGGSKALPDSNKGGNAAIAAPPTPAEIAMEAAKSALPLRAKSLDTDSAATGLFHLIGTVGNRAVILKPDGSTTVVQTGDIINLGGPLSAKVDSIGGTTAILLINGKKKELTLEAVQELKDKAAASRRDESAYGHGAGGNGNKNDLSGHSRGGNE